MNLIILICLSVSLLHLNGLSCHPQISEYEEDVMAGFLRHNAVSSPRIVGGRRAKPGELPYILSLQWNGEHFCGASIVETSNGGQIAITAAHCVYYDGRLIRTSKLTVTAGSLTINGSTEEPNSQTLAVREIIVHEGYHHNDLRVPVNDIAILTLSGSFHKTRDVQPAKLPSRYDEDHDNDNVVRVSGWGVTEEGPELSEHLRLADVPLVSNDECAEKYSAVAGDEMVIYETNICAGVETGGHDTCQGDSGGPLATFKPNQGNELKLLGVTSWGLGNFLLKNLMFYRYVHLL